MPNFSKVDGTTEQSFAIGGPAGPQLQNDPSMAPPGGAVGHYDQTGTYYVPARAADAINANDLVNLQTLQRALAAQTAPPARDVFSAFGSADTSGSVF
jgi:hypothetical protein